MTERPISCTTLGCLTPATVRVRWIDYGFIPPEFRSEPFCSHDGEAFANAEGGRTIIPLATFDTPRKKHTR